MVIINESNKRIEVNSEVFNNLLDEACRQWCEFIEESPERKDGEGFANFFKEIFNEKLEEFSNNVANCS